MSGHAKHKSRRSDNSASNSKKDKSRKRSTSASSDSIVATANKHSSLEDKKFNSQKRKHRSSSRTKNSGDSFIGRIKLDKQSDKVVGERPEFCQNEPSYRSNNEVGMSSQGSDRLAVQSSEENLKERSGRFPTIERQVSCEPTKEKYRSRRRTKKHTERPALTKKLKKSHKRRRSSSSSSNSNDDSSSSSRSSSRSSSSSSSSRSSSTSSSNEKRKRQRKKKKLNKKIKRAEKKRSAERRKCKKSKEKSREPDKEIKQGMDQMAQDRLLKDINLELADRAKAMAPMTKEEWEKKQSVIRRVYDSETGRHRLIKGDGEILEEIVSRDRHMEINRQATKGDGEFFKARLGVNK